MKRSEFIQHLEDGTPATILVREVTGEVPAIFKIADGDDGIYYNRYGLMMAGPLMAALVTLNIRDETIPRKLRERIKAGEPCGAVLTGMVRTGYVSDYGSSIKSGARLVWRNVAEGEVRDRIVGEAQEIFTSSLVKLFD